MQKDVINKKDELEEDDFSPIGIDVADDSVIDDVYAEEEANPEAEKEAEPKIIISSEVKKKILVAAAGVIGAIAIAYGGGVAYYNSHFYAGTRINGFDCSNMTVEAAQQSIISGVEGYSYLLKERKGAVEEIKGSDLELKLETIGDLNEAKNRQNPWKWPFAGKDKHQAVNIIVTMNEDLLYKKVQELECISATREAMKGAASKVVYENGMFYVQADSDEELAVKRIFNSQPNGSLLSVKRPLSDFDDNKNIVSFSKLYECVKAGIYGLYPDMDLDVEGCYVTMSEEAGMKQALDTMNRYVSTKVSYIKGDEIIPLDGGSINLWVSVDDNYNVYLDEEQVAGWIRDLSMKYNTIGTERKFITSNNQEITISGGDYGWKLDVEDETEALCEIIKNGETTDREPVFSQRAEAMGNSDIDNTYVEISIAEQHLWFYKNGEVIVSTDIVSGNPYAGNATPTGVYRLKYKERNSILVGEDYRTPVSYWMPFNGGVGMHDANWRGSFGGSIYQGGGSHGCINLPPSIAGKIYSNIEAGNVVIVY